MTILSAQTLRVIRPVEPFIEATKIEGLSGGLSHCGYDIRIKQDVILPPGGFMLASSIERFKMPLDVAGTVHDKSTLARLGLTVQTTIIEPGWEGFLTIELSNNHPPEQTNVPTMLRGLLGSVSSLFQKSQWPIILLNWQINKANYDDEHTIVLKAGQPIAQVVFHHLDQPVEGYDGKYQNQADEPVRAIIEKTP